MDLSLYKDEAQLDKSPRKRRRDVKSESDPDTDEDYEESPRKKRSVKRLPVSQRASANKKRAAVNDESTESDEENLMEIKKKAKTQVGAKRFNN